jgi:hypothetical protein
MARSGAERKPYARHGHEPLSVWVPTSLLDHIRIRLLDPRFGRARYGAMRRTIIEALELWLDQRR